jgi:hypothetical protein
VLAVVSLFAVFAAVDSAVVICQDEHLIQSLFDGCDASRITAVNDVADLFGKLEVQFVHDLSVFNDIHSDIRVDKANGVKIQLIHRALNFDNVLFAHFVALGIFDDGDLGICFIQVQ